MSVLPVIHIVIHAKALHRLNVSLASPSISLEDQLAISVIIVAYMIVLVLQKMTVGYARHIIHTVSV